MGIAKWGLEVPAPPEHDKCPACGAPIKQWNEDELYHCGSVYPSKGEDQTELCKQNSFLVQRRFSTISGIIDACDPLEQRAVIGRILFKYRDI